MLCEDYSNANHLVELGCSLSVLIIGLASSSVITVLIYFTYEAVIGNRSYCTLWTDIPGRLAIFSTFYFVAATCGFLPLPERFRMNYVPQPFILYKLESWKRLFRNLRLLFSFDCPVDEVLENDRDDTETSPLREGSTERHYSSRGQSDTIPIEKSGSRTKRSRKQVKIKKTKDVEIAHSSEECSMSFDSPRGGHIVPMVKGKSTKPRYLSDSTISSGESSFGNMSSAILCESLETLPDEKKTVAKIQSEMGTSFGSLDVESSLPNYPRFPWVLLKYKSDLPQEAKILHKKNLTMERRELGKQNKKEGTGENVEKESEPVWEIDSDEFNLLAKRPRRLPVVPIRSKTGYQGRAKATRGSIRKLERMNLSIHKRTTSITAPNVNTPVEAVNVNPEKEVGLSEMNEKDEYCRNSPDLQAKIDCTEKTLRSVSHFQASNEASTFNQDIDVFPSNDSDPFES